MITSKQNRIDLFLFCLITLFLVVLPDVTWAADTSACSATCTEQNIFCIIRCRAADFISRFKSVLYILGGFGMIGFAFMAIFNKISWKWFSNIAIGLFLIAVMGMFIDYFTTSKGTKGDVTALLDYGYDMGTGPSSSINGTDGGIDAVDCNKTPDHQSCQADDCGEDMVLINGKCVNPDG